MTPDQVELASCRQHPELEWFPHAGQYLEAAAARAVCASCPVAEPCLEDALALSAARDHGIAGGTGRRDRIRIRAERRRQEPALDLESPVRSEHDSQHQARPVAR
jgi:hypothetical protein